MMSVERGIYRHFKGGLYYVVGLGQHTELDQTLVVYVSLNDEDRGTIYCRPASMFLETVEVEGKRVRRFVGISE